VICLSNNRPSSRLVINLNIAEAFGLSFPPGLLAIARAPGANGMMTCGALVPAAGSDGFGALAWSRARRRPPAPQERSKQQQAR
jgi:hypothetical protein